MYMYEYIYIYIYICIYIYRYILRERLRGSGGWAHLPGIRGQEVDFARRRGLRVYVLSRPLPELLFGVLRASSQVYRPVLGVVVSDLLAISGAILGVSCF